ncbi:wall-associated receptor kinase 1 [Lactuca sativa]|nr:wall-associated receptor kinase 1 [Lactuca sativa]
MNVRLFNPCGFAFLAEENHLGFGGARHVICLVLQSLKLSLDSNVHILVDWVIGGGKRNCSQATECKANRFCMDDEDLDGYRCSCNKGYQGNPYLHNGCQALVRIILTLAGIIGIFFSIKKRKLMKEQEKFFEKKLNSQEVDYTVTVYITKQLPKAIDNYSNERTVGRGGFEVVYKGVLSDKRVVAIKKYVSVGKTKNEQFINEVLVIMKIINGNVVKLLGYCLEEEVPVLVYEFIPNNTLFHHIHNEEGGTSWLSWENRLRVAVEAASTLAYLHSHATTPIINRDVKSANILLDDDFNAKLSDFGISKLFSIKEENVNTVVQDTLGYLDPECQHTNNTNEKSHVYSFGVVLAELITDKNKKNNKNFL